MLIHAREHLALKRDCSYLRELLASCLRQEMPRNGNKAAREERKWKANQKYVETHGKWIINTSHKLGSVRPIDLVSHNPDRLRKFESKEAVVAFEEE